MPKIFISYFRKDLKQVQRFLRALDKQEIPYWLDLNGLNVGDNWGTRIIEKITTASAFVLFVSRHYYESPDSYVHREVEAAISVLATLHRDVNWYFPVILDRSPVPDAPISENRRLSDYQIIDGGRRFSRPAETLSNRLRDHLSRPEQQLATINIKSNFKKQHASIELDGSIVSEGPLPLSMISIPVPPGIHSIRMYDSFIDNERGWDGEFYSNTLELSLSPRQHVTLNWRKSHGAGFLGWGRKENGCSWTLEVVGNSKTLGA